MEATILEGSWDIAITCNWAYNPTYDPPKWPYRVTPNISRVIPPVINTY